MLQSEDDLNLFPPPHARPKNTWCVLMVDDDAAVHTVTRLALRGYEYKGRSLEFISAFSGKEGQQVFADRQDIAVALVDVVMERDESGLDLVDYVRRTLDNHCTRLVLRTGQPGCLSKQSVEREHEIDDYREKTDLSIQKLRALLDSQLSAYQGSQHLQ